MKKIYRNNPKRKAPALSATSVPVGTRRRGLDGNMHAVMADRNGTHRWRRVETAKAANMTSTKRKKTRDQMMREAAKRLVGGMTKSEALRTVKRMNKFMPTSTKQRHRSGKKRCAPTASARDFPSGTRRKGLDGSTWVVKITKAKYKTWVRTAPAKRRVATKKRSSSANKISLTTLTREALKLVHPNQRIAKEATAIVVKLATPLARLLAKSTLRSALSAYYGGSKELINHTLSWVKSHGGGMGQAKAALFYLLTEVIELAGNHATWKYRSTIKPLDIREAMKSDTELRKLMKYT